MKSWNKPTDDEVARAVALLGKPAHRRHFFDRLENPEWVQPLKSKGFFSGPPPPERDESRGTIGFPAWEESRWLARMAPLKPEAVLSVIVEMPQTDNVVVCEDLVDAALAMPADIAAQLVDKAKRWARSPYLLLLLPDKLGSLMRHLAKGGQADAACHLAEALLEVLPDPRGADRARTYRFRPEPTARFDAWKYQEILKEDFPEVVRAAGKRAFLLLCELLETAIRLSRASEDEEGPEDYSYIWHPAVEDDEDAYRGEVKNALVSAVRDAGELLAGSGREGLRDLLSMLESRPWRVFHRVALHLLRRFREAARDPVAAHLTDRALFEDPEMRHEYALLAGECFGALTREHQEIILGWIEAGPQGWEPEDEEAEDHRKIWELTRLSWLKQHLPEDWKQRYDALVAQYGEPEHPEFSSYARVGWAGPASPKTAKEIEAMPVAALAEFLKTWEAPVGPMEPSPEELGRELSRVVAANPGPFAEEAARFRDLDATYLRAVLSGLADSLREGRAFAWPSVLDLCRWAVAQPREISGRRRETPYDHSDPDWGWTRGAAARLLSAGFEQGAARIPFEHRTAAWETLAALVSDPDPAPEQEAQSLSSGSDPGTLSMNTVRGQAMHAVVRYALWVRSTFESLTDPAQLLARGFSEMQEIREVLDEHLEVSRDPSLCIRSVYGQWFPWLLLLDPAWARDRAARIFPAGESDSALHDAAWNAYIVFCDPYDSALEVLRRQYSNAVERVGMTETRGGWLPDPAERLAEHLMTFYWRGKLNMGDPDQILTRFWARASDHLRAHAVEFVGRSLQNTEGSVPSEILARLQALWRGRVEVARGAAATGDYKGEMAAFGWWFTSGKFEDVWAIRQLSESLEIAGATEPITEVTKQLAALAEAMPGQAVQCLKALVRSDREGWGVYYWREDARRILAAGLASPDQSIARAAEDLVNELGDRGHLEFGELLRRA